MVIAEISKRGSSPRLQTSLFDGVFRNIEADRDAKEIAIRKSETGNDSVRLLASVILLGAYVGILIVIFFIHESFKDRTIISP